MSYWETCAHQLKTAPVHEPAALTYVRFIIESPTGQRFGFVGEEASERASEMLCDVGVGARKLGVTDDGRTILLVERVDACSTNARRRSAGAGA